MKLVLLLSVALLSFSTVSSAKEKATASDEHEVTTDQSHNPITGKTTTTRTKKHVMKDAGPHHDDTVTKTTEIKTEHKE